MFLKKSRVLILFLFCSISARASVDLGVPFTSPRLPSLGCEAWFAHVGKPSAQDLAGLKPISFKKAVREGYDSPSMGAYKILKSFSYHHEGAIPRSWHASLFSLIKDESEAVYHDVISQVFISASNQIAYFKTKKNKTLSALEIQNILFAELEAVLRKRVPLQDVAARLDLLRRSEVSLGDLKAALGQLDLEGALSKLLGPGGIHDVSPDSILGEYLLAAKNMGIDVQTKISRFPRGPGQDGFGGEKWFVSVDSSTAPLLSKLLAGNPHYLYHAHTPGQTTLHLKFRGHNVSYAAYDYPTGFIFHAGAIEPLIVLSSEEGNALNNYLLLGTLERKFAKYPWGFNQGAERKEGSAYCREGGYGSCTHWVGEMPIGERWVNQYHFPGYLGDDRYLHGHREQPKDKDPELRSSILPDYYDHFISPGEVIPLSKSDRVHRLARMVWLPGMGREQFFSLIGDNQAEGLAEGEWANPGWVLYALLTRSYQARVPVVFFYRRDASLPLTEKEIHEYVRNIKPL